MMLPDFISEISQAKLPQAIQAFLRMQQAMLMLLQDIKDTLQPVAVSEPLPLDFEIVTGVGVGAGYQTTVNLSITKIVLASAAAGPYTIWFGENSPWLLAYPIAANATIIIDLQDDRARMVGRGVRIQVSGPDTLKCHMWARTS